MTELNSYINKHFPNLSLNKPLLDKWPIGLRFQLGTDKINERYFDDLLKRALSIFEKTFSPSDDIFLIYQERTDENKFSTDNYCFQNISGIDRIFINYETLTQLYEVGDTWTRAMEISVNKINYKNILTAISNWDFQDRAPQIEGETFFVNINSNIILHMYDDRGLDIIASNADSLSIYKDFSSWVIEKAR